MPLTLTDGELRLRPLAPSDARAWSDVRRRNQAWLSPWDATNPPETIDPPPTFRQMVRRFRAEARAGRSIALAISVNETFVGQVTLGGITWGSLRSAYIGYWIDQAVAGRGYMPRAVALVGDYAFGPLQLHRLEINVRPENTASIRVAQKLGFRDEGMRRRYLHINGDWRDHIAFALTVDEARDGLLHRVARR